MVMGKYANYQLSYKTGWGPNDKASAAWIVGWIEENKHPYFFVLQLEVLIKKSIWHHQDQYAEGDVKEIWFFRREKIKE